MPGRKALASAVMRICSDYKRFSKAARERGVKKFDVRPWLERHKVVFESLVSYKLSLSPALFDRSSTQGSQRDKNSV